MLGEGGMEFMETSKNKGIITALSTSGNEEEREAVRQWE